MSDLSSNQAAFLSFLLSSGALLFGDFTTKSGRKTPYFINTGKLHTGSSISRLGNFYAAHILETSSEPPTIIFGPAYKGIPLAVSTASALSTVFKTEVSFSFDRKETKQHGDKGVFVGADPSAESRIFIVEDVVTAGTTLRSIVPFLREYASVHIAGVVISVDRCEVGTGTISAVRELEQELAITIHPILTIHQIVTALSSSNAFGLTLDKAQKESIHDYLSRYGASI